MQSGEGAARDADDLASMTPQGLHQSRSDAAATTTPPGLYLTVDAAGRITEAQGATIADLTADGRTAHGRPLAAALRQTPELEEALRDALDGQPGVIRCTIGDDELEIRVAPLFDEAGDLHGAVALGGTPPPSPAAPALADSTHDAHPTSAAAAPPPAAAAATVAEADEFPGRQAIETALESAIRAAARGHDSGLLHVHLDELALVACGHGPEAAEAFLADAAAALREAFPRPAIIARVGTASFAVMLEYLHGNPVEAAAAAAEHAVEALNGIVTVDGAEVRRTARASAMLIQTGDERPAEVLQFLADETAAMRDGTARLASPAADRASDARTELRIRTRLPLAAERGELRLEYQPIRSFVEDRVYGVEAYLRWTDARLGPVSPGRFIPVAEELGTVHALGAWVIEELCRHASRWELDGRAFHLHFNASVAELQRPDYAHDILRTIARHDLEPSRFVLEVTESAAALDPLRAADQLAELRAAGMRVALGDFGSGDGSLTRLRDLPLDMLKFGRGLIADAALSREVRAILAGAVAIAADLGLETVAEGIETDEQRSLVVRAGCTHGQGYMLGRPSGEAPEQERRFRLKPRRWRRGSRATAP